jgi:hypothetical protein
VAGYSANNLCVYLAAFAGGLAGLTASGKFLLDAIRSDYAYPAQQADAFAQAVDQAWGVGPYTNVDLQQIQEISQAVWQSGRSQLPNGGQSTSRFSYAGVAAAIVAATQAGTAQVVAEGLNPNGCGAGSTILTAPFTFVTTTPFNTTAVKLAVNATNSAITINLLGPIANLAIYTVASIAGSNPIIIVPPAGITIQDPSSGGAFDSSAVLPNGGGGDRAWWQYNSSTSQLIQIV